MICRACGDNDLFLAIDLGKMPIANELLYSQDTNVELFDLKMFICKKCGLGRTYPDLEATRLFENNYAYKSSVSQSLLEYSEQYANEQIDKLNISPNDWVLELASNDGYLLQYFKNKNIDVLGIDPAKNMANYALCNGIPTIVNFFGSRLAKEILRIKGYPKLIIANNVLAHVPDIQDFMDGISILCNDETVVSIENPTIMNILLKEHFDTIYHEHYSYLSCNSVYRLSKKFGLNLFNIEQVDTQGGSNRYWLSKTKDIDDVIQQTINFENKNGLFEQDAWIKLQQSIDNKIKNFVLKLKNKYDLNKTVCGYAASAKAVQILNYAKINPSYIKSIVDDSLEKQNLFFPGLKIPIKSINDVLKENPTDIIIFSWNIYDELKEKINKINKNINIYVWSDFK